MENDYVPELWGTAMLFAVIGGTHGDVGALDAALRCVDDMGIHTILCTGNLAAGNKMGNEVVDRLRQRRIVCVQGEEDRLVVRALRKAESLRRRLDPETFATIQRAHEQLASGNVEYLRALPPRLSLTLEGKSVNLCHGSVASQRIALRESDNAEHFRRQREAANAEIIVCGSGEGAFVRVVDGTLFVNPGKLSPATATVRFVVVDTDTEPMSGRIVPVDQDPRAQN